MNGAAAKGARVRPNRLLMHCPEVTLKGKNRLRLQRRLCENIAHRLSCEGIDWPVKPAYGRVYVDVDTGAAEGDVERAVSLLTQVAGVSSLAATVWLRPSKTRQHESELDWPLIESTATALAESVFEPGRSFAVRVNRTDARVRVTGPEIESRLGGVVRRETGWQRVDLETPDRTLRIDVYPDGMYFYAEKLEGVGGIPVGTAGHVLSLLSGGIDSPVASFMMTKRGCSLDLFHMSATFADADGIDASVVGGLARRISRFSLRTRLWVAPYVHFDMALPQDDSGYGLLLFRRFLLRTAEALALRVRARALVTGDSLGQVASQTLENLVSTSQATRMTVLRPLVGLNKEEIMRIARRIGTFETSIQPYKDCCALLATNPRTRSHGRTTGALEKRLIPDYDRLIEQTLNDTVCVSYDCGRRAASASATPTRAPSE